MQGNFRQYWRHVNYGKAPQTQKLFGGTFFPYLQMVFNSQPLFPLQNMLKNLVYSFTHTQCSTQCVRYIQSIYDDSMCASVHWIGRFNRCVHSVCRSVCLLHWLFTSVPLNMIIWFGLWFDSCVCVCVFVSFSLWILRTLTLPSIPIWTTNNEANMCAQSDSVIRFLPFD